VDRGRYRRARHPGPHRHHLGPGRLCLLDGGDRLRPAGPGDPFKQPVAQQSGDGPTCGHRRQIPLIDPDR
jgi:hypothetical protein